MTAGEWIAIIAGIGGLLSGLGSLYIMLKKNPHEIGNLDEQTKRIQVDAEKAKAETDDIHGKIADRWAEHVQELMGKMEVLEKQRDTDREEIKGLRLDIAQVRRENEEYRNENSDLKDWIERLMKQLSTHAPHVTPEKFIRRVYE